MRRFATQGKRRSKCPLCGGEIEISCLYQYSHNHKLTKSGRISKKYKTYDCGFMEVTIAGCACGANWGQGEFDITEDGYFVDYKYEEEPCDI